MATTAAVLDITIKANTRGAMTGLQKTNKQLQTVDKQTKKTEGRMTAMSRAGSRGFGLLATGAKAGGLALGVGLVGGLKKANDESREAAKVGRLTASVLKSTGGAANVTQKEVERLATSISKKVGVDDEAIQSSQNLLLTFTKVRNETGRGNKIFTQASHVVADFSARFGKDLNSSAILVGKALQDPIKGTTALTRVGVQFDEQQKKQIKTMVESGNILGAQKVILGELGKQTKGAGAAAADGMDHFKVAIGNVLESLGGPLTAGLNTAAQAATRFIEQFRMGTGAGGQFRTTVEGVGRVIANIASIVGPAVAAVGKLGFEFLGTNRGIVVLSGAIGALAGRMAALAAAFIVGKVAAFTAGITAAGGAMRALSAAIATNPLGLLAVVIGTIAGALIGMRGQTDGAKQSQQQFSAAVEATRSAFDRYRAAIDAVKDSNLAHKGALLNLQQAEANLASLRRSGTASSLQIKQAEHQVATARREVKRTADDARVAEVRKREETAKSLGQLRQYIPVLANRARREQNTIAFVRAGINADRAAGASKEELKGRVKSLRDMMSQHAGTTSRLSARIRELKNSSIPAKDKIAILRDTMRALREQGEGTTSRMQALRKEITKLKGKKIKVSVAIDLAAQGVGSKPFGSGWPVEKATGQMIQAAASAGKIDVFGTGAVGTAKGNLGKYEALGHRFGLRTTSGYRPGDPGYHGSNRARDLSNGSGPTSQMLKFARFMASRFGGNLLELIYSPLGFSIKNGKKVPPYAVGDHYDHVHVAAQRGAMVPGSGSGDKVRALLEPGEGIINKKAVRAMGGRGAIDALNSMVPRFQGGGVIGTFANQVRRSGLKGRKAAVIYEAMLRANAVEAGSLGANPRKGDRDSLGVFQIRAMHGPANKRMDPKWSANWFIRNARSRYRNGMSAAQLAALVERPAAQFRGRYGDPRFVPVKRIRQLVEAFQAGEGPGKKKRTKKQQRLLGQKGLGTDPYGRPISGGKPVQTLAQQLGITKGIGNQFIDMGGGIRQSVGKGIPFTPQKVPRGQETDGPGEAAEDPRIAATAALAEELKGLKAEIAKQNAFSASVSAVGLAQAHRALADMVAGQLGTMAAQRMTTPSTGALARY